MRFGFIIKWILKREQLFPDLKFFWLHTIYFKASEKAISLDSKTLKIRLVGISKGIE